MSDPNYAEWQHAIRVLERTASELTGEGPSAAILVRVARYMRKNGPPRPPMLNRSAWAHVDQLVAQAFARARGEP